MDVIVGLAKTTLEQWAVLAAVVDEGGFAQAALALNRSQSAVSYSIARLQESLDLPLLVVEGRKSVLTPHGQTLLARGRGLVKDLETLELLANSLKQGWEPELKLVVDAAFPRDRLLRIVAELQRGAEETEVIAQQRLLAQFGGVRLEALDGLGLAGVDFLELVHGDYSDS